MQGNQSQFGNRQAGGEYLSTHGACVQKKLFSTHWRHLSSGHSGDPKWRGSEMKGIRILWGSEVKSTDVWAATLTRVSFRIFSKQSSPPVELLSRTYVKRFSYNKKNIIYFGDVFTS